jgi:hypothetical protein
MLVAGIVAVSAALAASGPSVTITSPKTGTSYSAKKTPNISVTGTAAFAAASGPTTTKFYLRRDGCGTSADNPHLSVTAGNPDAGDGCGIIGGQGITGAGAPGLTATDYPTADGMPIVLDASKTITGTLDINSDLDGVGQMTIDFTLEALVNGEGIVVGTDSETITVDPTTSEYTVPFSVTPAASLDKANLSGLDLHVNESGPYVGSGYVGLSGKSYLTVIGLPPVTERSVQLSLDDSTFAHPVAATLSSTFTSFSQTIATPAVGTHTLYARAIQDLNTSSVASSTFTVKR